jgi:hypothetical protein
MKGRWAAGIVPRNFAWIIKGHLAVSERPGGSAPDHRRVRRQEEILWLRAQGFTRVVSLLASSHNLHAYEELGLEYAHVSMGVRADIPTVLGELYPKLLGWLHAGDRVLVHQDELSDRVAGVFAGFLWWSGMIPEPPLAISAIEHLLRRQLGTQGRTIATLAMELPPPAEEDRRRPAPPPGETVVSLRVEEPETREPVGTAVAGRGHLAVPAPEPTGASGAPAATVAEIAARRARPRSRRKPTVAEPQPVRPAKPARPAAAKAAGAQPAPKIARAPSRRPGSTQAKTRTRRAVAKPTVSSAKPAPRSSKAASAKPVPKPAKVTARTTASAAKVAGSVSARPVTRRRVGAR